MTAVFQEWLLQNSQRNYPFCDAASMLDSAGAMVPQDLVVDAILYPQGLLGFPYLLRIDGPNRAFYFGDSMTQKAIGVCRWSPGDTRAQVQDTSQYSRPIGTLVFGPGINSIDTTAVRTFAPRSTQLAPTAYVALNQTGVTGLVLPDGTLMTGNITITGQDGVVVSTQNGVLRVDCTGVPSPDPETCGTLGPRICTIKAVREPGSSFVISQYDTAALAVTLDGRSLDDICGAARGRRQDAIQAPQPTTPYSPGHDACIPPPAPPGPPDPGSRVEIDFNVCQDGAGSFVVVAPSTPQYRNPIAIYPEPRGPVQPDNTVAQKAGELPAQAAGLARIVIQGLGSGQLP